MLPIDAYRVTRHSALADDNTEPIDLAFIDPPYAHTEPGPEFARLQRMLAELGAKLLHSRWTDQHPTPDQGPDRATHSRRFSCRAAIDLRFDANQLARARCVTVPELPHPGLFHSGGRDPHLPLRGTFSRGGEGMFMPSPLREKVAGGRMRGRPAAPRGQSRFWRQRPSSAAPRHLLPGGEGMFMPSPLREKVAGGRMRGEASAPLADNETALLPHVLATLAPDGSPTRAEIGHESPQRLRHALNPDHRLFAGEVFTDVCRRPLIPGGAVGEQG